MIDVYWDDNEKTIVRHDYTESWTWEDYIQAANKTREMMDSVSYTVDVIMDLGERGMMPEVAFFEGCSMTDAQKHSNAGLKIAISSSNFGKDFGNLFNRLYPDMSDSLHIRFASSLPEAYSMIQNVRVA